MIKKTLYNRLCPNCDNIINYNWKCDYDYAIVNISKCASCSTKKTQFKKGHQLNELYSIRENSLDTLLEESNISFYWIGFLIADGYFKDNLFELCLGEKDKIHLEKFSKYIKYTKEIKYRCDTKSYRLYFSNKNSIPIIMLKYGIINKKTYNPIDFSLLSGYSRELLISLLIGIIDGDGSINSFRIKITSHECWYDFYKKIMEYLNIPINIKKVNNRNVISVIISKKQDIDTIVNNIKENNLPFLERKWIDIIKQRT